MGDVVTVDPAELTTHAGQIDSFMGQLESATGQAGDTFDIQAFGVACIFLAQILNVWVDSADAAVGSAVSAGRTVADAVREMAQDYATADENAAAMLEAAAAGQGEGGENPLVSEAEGFTPGLTGFKAGDAGADFEGAGIFYDEASTISDIAHGDWTAVGIDAASDALDTLGVIADPLGSLLGAGIGWLIEHIGFLKEALNLVAGQPEDVRRKAEIWQNIAGALDTSAQDYRQSAQAVTGQFTGSAADAYLRGVGNYCTVVEGASAEAKKAATAFNVAGAAVGTVRGVIRDSLSQFAGDAIVKWAAATALAFVTFGATEAAFIVDEVAEGTSLALRNAAKVSRLVKELKELADGGEKSARALEDVSRGMKSADKAVKGAKKAATDARNASHASSKAAGEVKNLKNFGQAARDAQAARTSLKDARALAEASGDTNSLKYLDRLDRLMNKDAGIRAADREKYLEQTVKGVHENGSAALREFFEKYSVKLGGSKDDPTVEIDGRGAVSETITQGGLSRQNANGESETEIEDGSLVGSE